MLDWGSNPFFFIIGLAQGLFSLWQRSPATTHALHPTHTSQFHAFILLTSSSSSHTHITLYPYKITSNRLREGEEICYQAWRYCFTSNNNEGENSGGSRW